MVTKKVNSFVTNSTVGRGYGKIATTFSSNRTYFGHIVSYLVAKSKYFSIKSTFFLLVAKGCVFYDTIFLLQNHFY